MSQRIWFLLALNIVVVRQSTTEVPNWRDSEKHINVLKNILNKMKI